MVVVPGGGGSSMSVIRKEEHLVYKDNVDVIIMSSSGIISYSDQSSTLARGHQLNAWVRSALLWYYIE